MAKPPKLELAYEPRNDRQRLIRELWPQTRLLIATGEAGTGKTTAALGEALAEVAAGRSRRILLCRPTVAVEEELGFLPGDLNAKLGPWLSAFGDCLGEISNATLDSLLKDVVEMVPIGMLRGRTVSGGTLIVDEAQNCTERQLLCAATRVGRGGRVVLCGDPLQSDIATAPNPLTAFAKRVQKVKGVAWVQFEDEDQVRDEFVSALLRQFKAKR